MVLDLLDLSSTPKTPHRSTHSSVPHRLYRATFCLRDVWNWGVLVWNLGEGELRDFVWNWGVCWTEGFYVWNWGGPHWHCRIWFNSIKRSLTIRFKQYNELSDIFYWWNIKIDEVAPFSFSQPRNKRKEKEEKRREWDTINYFIFCSKWPENRHRSRILPFFEKAVTHFIQI